MDFFFQTRTNIVVYILHRYVEQVAENAVWVVMTLQLLPHLFQLFEEIVIQVFAITILTNELGKICYTFVGMLG